LNNPRKYLHNIVIMVKYKYILKGVGKLIYHHLYNKFRKQENVKAGVIGAGQYSTAVITQSMFNPFLTIPVVADQDINAAKLAYHRAGIPDENIVECEKYSDAIKAIEAGKYVVTTDPMILMKLPLDIIAEGTGVPEAGALYGYEAIKNGKHVAMINKETDSVVGPILRHLAEKAGLVYTPVDGDQHGLLMGLVSWARGLGLEVISAGKARDAEYVYDRKTNIITCEADGKTVLETKKVHLTKETEKYINPLTDDVKNYICRRREIMSDLPTAGDFDLCELQITANATGLMPGTPTTYQPISRISEIPKVLCPVDEGGLLENKGIIDVVTCFREPHEAGLGGGIFIVVSSENEYSRMILTTKGLLSNSSGTASLIYRPYHLCGVETPTSLLCAGLLGISTGNDEYLPSYDLVKVVQRNMKKGEILGGDYTPDLKASILPAEATANGAPIPAHLLNGNKLIKDIQAGTLLTYEMVEPQSDSILWKLRKQQDELFLR